jgi:putative phosphoserine phosphatase/1-acylglycerol-3-phosphate O-acyltransferase
MAGTDAALKAIQDAPTGPEVAAFFDFDGTLIDGYSAAAFYRDRMRNLRLGPVELAQTLLATARGVSTTEQFTELAELALRDWAGHPPEDLDELGERLFRQAVAATVLHDTWRLVKAHQRRRHTVAIATSANHFQVAPLARELDIEHVLCTELEEQGGLLTGRLAENPLWGEGKADAVRKFAAERGAELDSSFGYSNGAEDVPFLEAVGRPQAVNPDRRLAATAKRRGWPVHRLGSSGESTPAAVARTAAVFGGALAGITTGLTLGLLNRDRRLAVDTAAAVAGELGFAAAGVRVEVHGEEHLWSHRPVVFLINHQSGLVDFLVICKLARKGFGGLAKKEAANVPTFGQFLRLADFAFVERSGGDPAKLREALEPAVAKLREGVSLLVAPEGTRSLTPRPGPFKKGAFHLAMQAGVPIVPIVIRNAGELMWRDAKTIRPGILQVAVLPPIDISGWTSSELTERVAEVRQTFVDTLADWPDSQPGKELGT